MVIYVIKVRILSSFSKDIQLVKIEECLFRLVRTRNEDKASSGWPIFV